MLYDPQLHILQMVAALVRVARNMTFQCRRHAWPNTHSAETRQLLPNVHSCIKPCHGGVWARQGGGSSRQTCRPPAPLELGRGLAVQRCQIPLRLRHTQSKVKHRHRRRCHRCYRPVCSGIMADGCPSRAVDTCRRHRHLPARGRAGGRTGGRADGRADGRTGTEGRADGRKKRLVAASIAE